jgi:hypothetical protein
MRGNTLIDGSKTSRTKPIPDRTKEEKSVERVPMDNVVLGLSISVAVNQRQIPPYIVRPNEHLSHALYRPEPDNASLFQTIKVVIELFFAVVTPCFRFFSQPISMFSWPNSGGWGAKIRNGGRLAAQPQNKESKG